MDVPGGLVTLGVQTALVRLVPHPAETVCDLLLAGSLGRADHPLGREAAAAVRRG